MTELRQLLEPFLETELKQTRYSHGGKLIFLKYTTITLMSIS